MVRVPKIYTFPGDVATVGRRREVVKTFLSLSSGTIESFTKDLWYWYYRW